MPQLQRRIVPTSDLPQSVAGVPVDDLPDSLRVSSKMVPVDDLPAGLASGGSVPDDDLPEGPGFGSRVGTRLLEAIQSILDVGSGRGFGTVPRAITTGEQAYQPVEAKPVLGSVDIPFLGSAGKVPRSVNPAPATLPSAIGAVMTPAAPLITGAMLAGESVAPEVGLPPLVGGLVGGLGPAMVKGAGRAISHGRAIGRERDELLAKIAASSDESLSIESKLAASVSNAPVVREKIAKVTDDLLAEGGAVRDSTRPAVDQLTDLLATDKISLPRVQEILSAEKLSPLEFANAMFQPGTPNATSRLTSLGKFSTHIDELLKKLPDVDRATWKEFAETSRAIDEWQFARSYYQRGMNLWRGLLVSQPATAIRNLETQIGRLPLDALVDTVDRVLPRWLGGSKTKLTDPWPSVEAFFNVFRTGNKAKVDAILKDLPGDYEKLFGSFASDVSKRSREAGTVVGTGSRADKLFSRAEDSVDVLNRLNQLQEFHTRRAVFLANFDSGKSIAQSIDKALEVTFAQQPSSTTGKAFVELTNKLPGAAFAIPFPRFLTNSLKFLFDYNPTGFLKLLSPKELTKVAAGDSQTIAKALTGSAMLGTAILLRDSEFAGSKWYEIRVPGTDRFVDARAFNPFSAYLFVADWLKRNEEGTQLRDRGIDEGLGALGFSYRGPAPLDLVREAIDAIQAPGEKGLPKAQQLAGQTVGGLLTPLQAIKDIADGVTGMLQGEGITGGASVVKDSGSEPLLGPALSKIPARESDLPNLPAAVSATRAGPITREAPLLRQLTGLSLTQPKNAAEKELDRLGYTTRDVFHGLGSPTDNRLLKSFQGPLVERGLSMVVGSPGYKNLPSNAMKKLFVDETLKVIREVALESAEANDPGLALRLAERRIPRRIKELLAERQSKLRELEPAETGE